MKKTEVTDETEAVRLISRNVDTHCRQKGYSSGGSVNNFVPHDCVSALAMAKTLINFEFDDYIAISPEGHIYGYFFEQLGVPVKSVYTDYPASKVESVDQLELAGKRVLLIEDDVISGRTLSLVVDFVASLHPQAISLYLGHTKGIQHLHNVPPIIKEVFVAEDILRAEDRATQVRAFIDFAL